MKKLKKWLAEAKAIFYPKCVYGSLFPLVFSLKWSGLLPYKVVDQNFISSKTGYVVASINQLAFAYAFVLTIMKNTSFIECFFKTDISKVGNQLHFVVSIASMIIIYASCLLQKKQIKNIFDRLYRIDSKLNQLSFHLDYRRGFRYNFIALIFLWTFYYSFTLGSIALILSSNKKFQVHSWVSYFLPNFMVNLIVFMFVCVLKQIRSRYGGCNQVYKPFLFE